MSFVWKTQKNVQYSTEKKKKNLLAHRIICPSILFIYPPPEEL